MSRFVNATAPFAALAFLALTGCGASSAGGPNTSPSPTPTRLAHAEDVIVPPPGASWPRPADRSVVEGPRYPAAARSAGIEDRVIAAFVIDEQGRVEYPTISILNRPEERGFADAVCTFLRGAEFSWAPHVPARGLVIMPFEFTLNDKADVRRPLPRRPNLDSLSDVARHLTPAQMTAWIESKPHCP